MKFYIEFDTDNAAFGETDHERNAEVANMLEDIADRLREEGQSGNIRDINGNTVGSFGYTQFSAHHEKD